MLRISILNEVFDGVTLSIKSLWGRKKEDKIQSVAKVSSLLFHVETGELTFRKVSTGMTPIPVSKATLVIDGLLKIKLEHIRTPMLHRNDNILNAG